MVKVYLLWIVVSYHCLSLLNRAYSWPVFSSEAVNAKKGFSLLRGLEGNSVSREVMNFLKDPAMAVIVVNKMYVIRNEISLETFIVSPFM